MTNTITGYQYGDNLAYIGLYKFPINPDSDYVHLPPRTLLNAPPTDIPYGQEAAYDEASNGWVLRSKG